MTSSRPVSRVALSRGAALCEPASMGARPRRRAAALATLLTAALPLGPVLAAPPAQAAEGATVGFSGHGWGHGRGMGQWGALGYAADQGWSDQRILDHYYGGTTAGTIPDVDLTVRLTALDGAASIAITSRAPFRVDGFAIGGGDAAVFTRAGDGWTMTGRPGGCNGANLPSGVGVGRIPTVSTVSAPGDDRSRMLTVCGVDRPYRGALRPTVDPDGASRLVNVVDIESYLRGVVPRESSASWADVGGAAALRAQAVAARSYAAAERRSTYASTCDTTSCQVYGGAASEDPRSDAAVAATAGVVRRTAAGAVARTEFSASTGGWTAGGQFTAVPDEGDVRAPRHDWTLSVPVARIEAVYPTVGTFRSLTVTARNGLGADGGRATAVRIDGSRGSTTTTGDAVRGALGLFSDWFTPVATTQKQWMLRSTATAGDPETVARYGDDQAVAVSCDTDGDGRDGLTVYRGNTWYVRDAVTAGSADRVFSYGGNGWVPVCGDWDGDGHDGIGVYDPATGTWYLRNSATPGPPDARFQYGWSAATPVVGDWAKDGRDSVGVYDPATGTWLLRLSPGAGAPDLRVQYGYPGAVPVPGDWDGDGRTTLGVYDGGRWLLRDSLLPGAPDRVLGYGAPGYLPIPGRWGGPGDGVGVSLAVS